VTVKKILDVTIPIKNKMPVWPGDPNVENKLISSIETNDEANVTFIQMSAHAGTHIDAPRHFIHEAKTIDQLNLDLLIGEVEVIEIDQTIELIDRMVLQNFEKSNWPKRIFLKTRNSSLRLFEKEIFNPHFTALTLDGAEFFIRNGVKLIGIDYLSIAPFDNGAPTHLALLKNDVVIIEGVNLMDVPPGFYELIALPILLDGADGAPARVLLINNNNG